MEIEKVLGYEFEKNVKHIKSNAAILPFQKQTTKMEIEKVLGYEFEKNIKQHIKSNTAILPFQK